MGILSQGTGKIIDRQSSTTLFHQNSIAIVWRYKLSTRIHYIALSQQAYHRVGVSKYNATSLEDSPELEKLPLIDTKGNTERNCGISYSSALRVLSGTTNRCVWCVGSTCLGTPALTSTPTLLITKWSPISTATVSAYTHTLQESTHQSVKYFLRWKRKRHLHNWRCCCFCRSK